MFFSSLLSQASLKAHWTPPPIKKGTKSILRKVSNSTPICYCFTILKGFTDSGEASLLEAGRMLSVPSAGSWVLPGVDAPGLPV